MLSEGAVERKIVVLGAITVALGVADGLSLLYLAGNTIPRKPAVAWLDAIDQFPKFVEGAIADTANLAFAATFSKRLLGLVQVGEGSLRYLALGGRGGHLKVEDEPAGRE